MVINTLSWTSILRLIVCKIRNANLQNQRITWRDQVRGSIPLLISGPKGQARNKSQGFTLITNQGFRKFLNKFKSSTYLGYKSKQVHNETTKDYFFIITHINKLIEINRHV